MTTTINAELNKWDGQTNIDWHRVIETWLLRNCLPIGKLKLCWPAIGSLVCVLANHWSFELYYIIFHRHSRRAMRFYTYFKSNFIDWTMEMLRLLFNTYTVPYCCVLEFTISKQTHWLFGKDYRVATLFKLYTNVSGIIMQSLKYIRRF